MFFKRQALKAIFIGFIVWLGIVAPNAQFVVMCVVMLIGLYAVIFMVIPGAFRVAKRLWSKRKIRG